MPNSFPRRSRIILLGALLTSGVLGAIYSPQPAMAAEDPTCYLMVCEGKVCVATQIPCP